jgi:flagellum-specific peptidoglycan hydrolase FlgJ
MQPGAPDMTPRKDETPEEFRARQRARYAAADPEYRQRRLARQRERRRRRYATDPVYREELLKRLRKRYATDPEYRQQLLKRLRKRYAQNRQRQREI